MTDRCDLQLLRYATKVRRLYPFGIPRSLLNPTHASTFSPATVADAKEIESSHDSLSPPKIIFISPWAGKADSPERKLLQAAVEKGLQYSMNETLLFDIEKAATELLTQKDETPVVVLGRDHLVENSSLCGYLNERMVRLPSSVIFSEDLSHALTSSRSKRALWEDLQRVLQQGKER